MFSLPSLRTPIGRLCFIGVVEGISYLVLLGIAMPLKYFAGYPSAVRMVGSAHGALFILFFASVLEVAIRRPWWSGKFWGTAFLASLVPFGTFWFDGWLKKVEAADAVGASIENI